MKGQQEYAPDWIASGENEKSSLLDLSLSLATQLEPLKFSQEVQKQFGAVELTALNEERIELEIDRVRSKLRQFELIVSKKIDKYYIQLRPQPFQKVETVESILQSMKKEKDLRNKLIQFQLTQINEIQEREKLFDSKENIQFAIPLEISQTKKKIEEVQLFIHVGQKKQKTRSQDLSKVQKNNLLQFQRIAFLRNNLQIAMIYEMTVTDRETKIGDHIYDFDKKLASLDKKLEELAEVVKQRHIPVSSNKNLLAMKEKKALLTKCRDDEHKKLMILNSNIAKNKNNLTREIEKLKLQLKEKEQRYQVVLIECQQLESKNTKFMNDQDLGKNLRKSISFNYAETLLKMKKNQSAILQKPNQLKNTPAKDHLVEKPNFKIRKSNNNSMLNYSSLQKFTSSKKQTANISDITLPITHQISKKKTQPLQLPNPEVKTIRKFEVRLNNKSRKKSELDQQIIQQY